MDERMINNGVEQNVISATQAGRQRPLTIPAQLCVGDDMCTTFRPPVWDIVDQASQESFPASDAPGWIP